MRFLLLPLAFLAGVLLGAALFRQTAQAPRATTPRHGPSAPGETPPLPPTSGVGEPSHAGPSAEISALIKRARRPDLPKGTGRITGRVRTKKGEPVAGIRIVARPADHPSRPKPRST